MIKLNRFIIIAALVGATIPIVGWVPVDDAYERYEPTIILEEPVYRVLAPIEVEEVTEEPVFEDVVVPDAAEEIAIPEFASDIERDIWFAKRDNCYLWEVPYDMTEAEYWASWDATLSVLVEEGGYDGLAFIGPYGIILDDNEFGEPGE